MTLIEPTTATFTHHFPYRLESVTRRRFDALCGRDPAGRSRVERHDRDVRRNAGTVSDMSKRYRTLDHVYAGEWAQVENLRRHGERVGVRPQAWSSLVEADDAVTMRWYPPSEVEEATAAWRRSLIG